MDYVWIMRCGGDLMKGVDVGLLVVVECGVVGGVLYE